ncbi:MAG: hypothetical protein MZV65_32190 [Chromatiales bacterium]|nr:hypothetical protein [Chromatiales bacterium]
MAFHGKERMDHAHPGAPARDARGRDGAADPARHSRRSSIGWLTIEPLLFGDYSAAPIFVAPAHDVLAQLGGACIHGAAAASCCTVLPACRSYWRWPVLVSCLVSVPGAAGARRIELASSAGRGSTRSCSTSATSTSSIEAIFVAAASAARRPRLWKCGDGAIIDGARVERHRPRAGRLVRARRDPALQTGYLYHYAFAMIIGAARSCSTWFLLGSWSDR